MKTAKAATKQTEAGEGLERLERFRQFVEKKVIAAPDERTRAIRLFILAATEAALSEA